MGQKLLVTLIAFLPALIFALAAHRFLFKITQLPAHKVLLAFMLGIAWAIPAYFLEKWLHELDLLDMTSIWEVFIGAFIFVALVEETGKVLGLYLADKINPIDERLDVLVISVMVSMGFAGVENILYCLNEGIEMALFRSVTSIPAHVIFALIMAYFPAMEFANRNKSLLIYLQGFLMAVLFHGLYDFFIIQEINEPLLLGALFILGFGIGIGYLIIRKIRALAKIESA